jgi:hypothetical protein
MNNNEKFGQPPLSTDIDREIEEGINEFKEGGIRGQLEYKDKILTQEGFPCEKRPVDLGKNIGTALGNECVPIGDFKNVESFYEAMLSRVEEYNNNLSENYKWMSIVPWEYNKSLKMLSHETGSGRMKIKLSDNVFSANLYSPAHMDAEQPFYSLTLEDGKLHSTLLDAEVLENGKRLDRLFHVKEYLSKTFDFDEILNASDSMTKRNIIESVREYLCNEIKYKEDEINDLIKRIETPLENDAYSPEYLKGIIQGHETYKASLKEELKDLEKK